MIAVIADDFTGAAEIGGIGLRYGLNVVIETEDIQDHNADLLIIATDTRSLPASDAMKHIYRITKGLQKLEPEFIFKKIDSVLRGNITDELIAQMEASGQNKAIVIAANPVFNRIIRDGIYYIDDVPLHETFFSTDPEFPVISSSVLDIVGKDSRINIESLKPGNLLPEKGLIIGDAVNIQDLEKWASFQNTDTLFAGAAGFFEAVLLKQFKIAAPHSLNPLPFGEKTLYVLGSTYPKDIDFLKKLEENGHFLVNMPEEIFYNKNHDPRCFDRWVDDVVKGIEEHHKVVASILHPASSEPDLSTWIRENIGKLAKKVVQKTELNELMVEGGATTSAVLKYLKIKKLFPIQELDAGVIRMIIDGKPNLCLTTKPGSYPWPDKVWDSETMNILRPN